MPALSLACKSTSNPKAAACLRQRLRRISAVRAVPAFVCQIGASVLRISVCVVSETGRQPNLGRIWRRRC